MINIMKLIKGLKRDSDNYLKKFYDELQTNRKELMRSDDEYMDASYELGFNDALNFILREVKK